MMVTLPELYLAYRQAKTALYFERRGVGLLDLAAFEERLPENLARLQSKLADHDWFDSVYHGDVFIVPKRFTSSTEPHDGIVHVGSPPKHPDERRLQVQLRLAPKPEFAILEVLYLWRFGAALDSLLSPNVLGHRLDLKDGRLLPHRRWLFEYWPTKYQRFRTEPLRAARHELSKADEKSVLIISADLASFYDTIDPSFLLTSEFVESLLTSISDKIEFDLQEYLNATSSLLRAYSKYRQQASRRLTISVDTGVPIGALTSRVVANLALVTLDAHIEAIPAILHYSRYVDDLVIVARAKDDAAQVNEILGRFFPLIPPKQEGVLSLDTKLLRRHGSNFQIQPTKVRIHHLTGDPGRDFINAVKADFARLVSERRSFVDEATLVHDGVSHLIRASQKHGSPLRVLRDADRARLERFSLSTSLHSLERVSALVDREHARRVVRRSVEQIARVLGSDANWVDQLDVTLRLLKLAISTGDWESCSELNAQLEATWGTVGDLRAQLSRLYYGDQPIDGERARPWTSLRNYLHARRLEAVCSALPLDAEESHIRKWLPEGLRVRTTRLGALALRRRARLLAASDLRSRDREDDQPIWEASADLNMEWMEEPLRTSEKLNERISTIKEFIDLCRQLGDPAWTMPPARLFLCTRPPSYFDIARRWLYRTESDSFGHDVFDRLLRVVNAIRGTDYRDPVGIVLDKHTVCISGRWSNTTGEAHSEKPRIILGNLVVKEDDWKRAATRVPGSTTGASRPNVRRLIVLNRVLSKAHRAAADRSSAVLVLPELSLPRRWFRTVANHVVRNGRFGLVVGLEYRHHRTKPYVLNQAFAVIPGPFSSVATWPWTKRLPAREEAKYLARMPTPVRFPPPPKRQRQRTVVLSPWGRFSVLICSELIEVRRVADLLGRVELVLCPAWNRDTSSYDHLIQSVGFQLHAIVAVANNGEYSDCRVWAPRSKRWERDLCRLIERKVDDVVYVDIPLSSLEAFHASRASDSSDWRPLPPDWP